MIPTKTENPNGFHARYSVSKLDGSPMPEGFESFILRLDDGARDKVHLRACREAVLTYADYIATTKPQVARDLYQRYNSNPEGGMLRVEPHF